MPPADNVEIVERLAIVETKLTNIIDDYRELKEKLVILNGNVCQLDNFKARLIGLAAGVSIIVGLVFNLAGFLWK